MECTLWEEFYLFHVSLVADEKLFQTVCFPLNQCWCRAEGVKAQAIICVVFIKIKSDSQTLGPMEGSMY